MYKYMCSKQECASSWTLQEGFLNGFVLTCPICSKGRGIFIYQNSRKLPIRKSDPYDQMIITIGNVDPDSMNSVKERLEELRKSYSLNVIDNGLNLDFSNQKLAVDNN
jgi:hypothetical protein